MYTCVYIYIYIYRKSPIPLGEGSMKHYHALSMYATRALLKAAGYIGDLTYQAHQAYQALSSLLK